ncbi:MAG: 16S rRNA (uracil(1498)-N(3))-methyltransferase [Candidatus Symbiothrix sp.]|jgi:16S rRNA (uracil1498-N3)-methyltransferase|nr:16S rRNA (uracil(1498)-N(3))-methyltransferase [Candidatus Symbiothrix sp.]
MLLFYAPDILQSSELPEQESQHCIRVLRKQTGDVIEITDGKGCFYQARIEDAHPKHCKINIITTIQARPSWKNWIEIAIAPTKNVERIEWFAEKAVEIGINKITFLKTRFSERKELKTDRIQKILISAMKQSEKAVLPELQAMTDFKQLMKQSFDGQKLIAHCYPGEKTLLSKAYQSNQNVLILIGPEGDFSREEVDLALSNGFQSISLGESRLRTETAALTACQTIHIVNQMKEMKK